MSTSPLLNELITALCCLPGVGPKSAQRMAFQLLEHKRDSGLTLSKTLKDALDNIGHCNTCRTFCEHPMCGICSNQHRNQQLLCIVETPADAWAIEQTQIFNGLYFILMGHLSPIDGIGPDDIGMDQLKQRFQENTINEIILATNPTVEGEATAYYIVQLAKQYKIQASRIAHGVPLGGELEYIDGGTLAHAFTGRTQMVEYSE